MTNEEKAMRRAVLLVKINTFMWGASWFAAFSCFMQIITGGGLLNVLVFAINAAWGIYFYPFKNGRWESLTIGGGNGKN